MREYTEILSAFKSIAENPRKQLDYLLAKGNKVVGCMLYFCPEELVYATGMTPFGIWGADMEIAESKRWFPAFVCSILQTTLELGIKGGYDGIEAIIVPKLCDSLKCMGANWERAVPGVPVINVAHAQNRKISAGVEFTASQYRIVADELARLSGKKATDQDISDAIDLINKRREAMRVFSQLASVHPEAVTPSERNYVIKSSYFMEAGAYTSMLKELNDTLIKLPESKWEGIRVVTTGILADSPALLDIFEENNIMIAGDQILHESVSFSTDTVITDDPIVGLADRLSAVEGTSILYDPGKLRAKELVKLVQNTLAHGVVFILTKFCDPEEYDYVPVKKHLEEKGIPCLTIEIDRQMAGFEQARSAIEAFANMLDNVKK